MILLACAQAAVAMLIGSVLILRGRRGWGWALIGLGGLILVMTGLMFFFASRVAPS